MRILASLAVVFSLSCTANLPIPEAPSSHHPVTVMLYNGVYYCAGTWVGPQQILTAAHCLTGGIPVVVEPWGGGSVIYAEVECADFKVDLALLRTPEYEASVWARIGSGTLPDGTAVATVGAPYQEPWQLTSGRILTTLGPKVVIDARIRPGNSGGGLFRISDGALVGVVVAYAPDFDSLGVAIRPSTVGRCRTY